MQVDITLVLAVCISLSLSCILYLNLVLSKTEIKEVFKERLGKLKEDNKRAKNSQAFITDQNRNELEAQLNSMLKRMDTYVSESERVSVMNNRQVSPTARICKGVISTVYSPYNKTSPYKLFLIICVSVGLGLIASVLLNNPAIAAAWVIMGVAVPFTLVSLSSSRNAMKNMSHRLHLLSVHLSNYKDDSVTLEESFRRCLNRFSQDSLEYKATEKVLEAMMSYGMDTHDSLKILADYIDAGTYEQDYFRVVEQAESIDSRYKNILSSIIKNFESQTVINLHHVNFAYYLYFIYIAAIVISIIGLFYMKTTDIEAYSKLNDIAMGRGAVFVIFMLECIIGIIIAASSKVITLVEVTYKPNEEDDIYVE